MPLIALMNERQVNNFWLHLPPLTLSGNSANFLDSPKRINDSAIFQVTDVDDGRNKLDAS